MPLRTSTQSPTRPGYQHHPNPPCRTNITPTSPQPPPAAPTVPSESSIHPYTYMLPYIHVTPPTFTRHATANTTVMPHHNAIAYITPTSPQPPPLLRQQCFLRISFTHTYMLPYIYVTPPTFTHHHATANTTVMPP